MNCIISYDFSTAISMFYVVVFICFAFHPLSEFYTTRFYIFL